MIESGGVHAGTHTYGYAPVSGTCVGVLAQTGQCVSGGQTFTKCHDRFYCIGCLQKHAEQLKGDGVGMEFVGELGHETIDLPLPAADVIAPPTMMDKREGEVQGILRVLHELYALSVDQGAYEVREMDEIHAKAKRLLADYGIGV